MLGNRHLLKLHLCTRLFKLHSRAHFRPEDFNKKAEEKVSTQVSPKMRFLLAAPFLTVATAALVRQDCCRIDRSCTSSRLFLQTAAPLLNDVAYTTVSCPGTSSGTRAVGEDIFGAMEAGFTATQLTSMWGSGCGTATLDGGIDTGTSEVPARIGLYAPYPHTRTHARTHARTHSPFPQKLAFC
jgi:hypothetical protein